MPIRKTIRIVIVGLTNSDDSLMTILESLKNNPGNRTLNNFYENMRPQRNSIMVADNIESREIVPHGQCAMK